MRSRASAWAAVLFVAAAAGMGGYGRVVTWTWSEVARTGPWLLLGLAVLNVLRSAVPTGAMAGPVVLTVGAVAAFAADGRLSAGVTRWQLVAAVLLFAAWVSWRLSAPIDRLTVALLWVARRRIVVAPPRIMVAAVFGAAFVDLSDVTGPMPSEIVCIAIGGRVEIRIPGSWNLTAAAPVATWWVHVADEGPIGDDSRNDESGSEYAVMVRLLGLGGTVGLTRVRV